VRAVWGAIKYGRVAADAPRHLGRLASTVRAMHAGGIRIVAGSDLTNHGTVAGRSLHRELDLLRAAGLSPADVLRAATTHAAAVLGVADSVGAVSPGMVASLVLLDGDPLRDVASLHRIHAVILRGRYLDRARLEALAREARDLVGGSRSDVSDEAPLPGRVIAAGRYTLSAGGQPMGEEHFTLAATDTAVLLRVRTTPGAGGPPGATTTYVLDERRRLRYAVREETGGAPRRTIYRIAGNVLHVQTVERDENPRAETVPIPRDGAVLGAELAAEMLLAPRIPSVIGDSARVEVLRFGEESARVRPTTMWIRRLPTDIVPNDVAIRYEVRYDSPWGPMQSTTVADGEGLPRESSTVFPVGSMRILARRQASPPP
jgi:hypothetical protein